MSRYFIPAIALAVAPHSVVSAEPAPSPPNNPPATCQQMHQGNMQQHMSSGTNGSGRMMQHGTGDMGTGHMDHGTMDHGTMGSGNMQRQMMQHGDHAGMGHGDHQAMMQGQAQCPAISQSQTEQAKSDK